MPEDPFITIIPETETSIVDSNQIEAVFSVKYSGKPKPIPTWHDINGDPIPWSAKKSKNSRLEATVDRQNQLTALKIKHPELADSGTYILLADNGLVQEEHEFQLLVKGINIRSSES